MTAAVDLFRARYRCTVIFQFPLRTLLTINTTHVSSQTTQTCPLANTLKKGAYQGLIMGTSVSPGLKGVVLECPVIIVRQQISPHPRPTQEMQGSKHRLDQPSSCPLPEPSSSNVGPLWGEGGDPGTPGNRMTDGNFPAIDHSCWSMAVARRHLPVPLRSFHRLNTGVCPD